MQVKITGYPQGLYGAEQEQPVAIEPTPQGQVKITGYPQPESFGAKVGRNILGAAESGLSTAIDLPSNIARTAAGLGNIAVSGLNKVTSKLGLPKAERYPTESIPLPSEYTIKPLAKALGAEEYLKPQTPNEESLHGYASDIASLMTPLGPIAKGFKLGKAALTAGAGALAKWGSKKAGASEGLSELIKTGTMVGASLIGKSGLENFERGKYNTAESALPNSALASKKSKLSMDKIEPVLKSFDKPLKLGKMTPSKLKVKEAIDAIRSKVNNGKIDVREVWELKKNLGEEYYATKKPYGLEKKIPEIIKSLNETLFDYGKTNKAFMKPFLEAESIHAGRLNMEPTVKFLQNHVNEDKIGKITGGMLLGYLSPQAAAGITAGSLGTRGAATVLNRFKNSNVIKKYYANVVRAAAQRNVKQLDKTVTQLDHYISKEFPENRS